MAVWPSDACPCLRGRPRTLLLSVPWGLRAEGPWLPLGGRAPSHPRVHGVRVGFTCGLPPTRPPCWRLAGRSTPVVNLFITDKRKIIHSLWPWWSGCEAGCRVKVRVGGGGALVSSSTRRLGSQEGGPCVPAAPGTGGGGQGHPSLDPPKCGNFEKEGGSPCS